MLQRDSRSPSNTKQQELLALYQLGATLSLAPLTPNCSHALAATAHHPAASPCQIWPRTGEMDLWDCWDKGNTINNWNYLAKATNISWRVGVRAHSGLVAPGQHAQEEREGEQTEEGWTGNFTGGGESFRVHMPQRDFFARGQNRQTENSSNNIKAFSFLLWGCRSKSQTLWTSPLVARVLEASSPNEHINRDY